MDERQEVGNRGKEQVRVRMSAELGNSGLHCAKVIWSKFTNRCTINRMAMTYRVSATLGTKSEAALSRIMKRTGWTKSQALREVIWAAAESQGLAKRPAPSRRSAKNVKVKS